MNKTDYYKILGVDSSATTDDIKTAYRKLAMKYHPDRNPNNKTAEDKFKEATEAYEVLGDTQKRSQYDQFGHAGMHNNGMGSGHGHSGNMNMEDIFENFGDIFGSMFGGGAAKHRRKKGPQPQAGLSLTKELEITLKEAFLGTKKEIAYHHFFTCDSCKGSGAQTGTSAQTCTTCNGSGEMHFKQGFFMYAQACTSCNGKGFIIPTPCSTCNGQSRVQRYDKFTVNIPHGIYDNAELRVSEKADAGLYGGPAGDLFLHIRVKENKAFKREQDDLVCHVMLTYPQLTLGCQLDIESIDETKHAIKIPKGCPVGEKIVISGEGFYKLRGKARGNLIIITQCFIPQKISAEAKKKLQEYADAVGTQTTNSEGFITSFFKKFLG
ncbi:MAG TPA: molecular chaperone DnaJ [Candidatus Babeliales bacterium]|nr:molecular chaperone DnaJ [Candidatus Babeliales bacterium]